MRASHILRSAAASASTASATATATPKPSRYPRRRLDPSKAASTPAPASIKHFILRSQVLSFYRSMIRLTRRCSDPAQSLEVRRHTRSEIETMRGAKEPHHIKALLQEGRRKMEQFETLLNMTK